MHITLQHYLIVSAMLFAVGLLGVIARRNLLVIYMCIELMLNAANLALVAFNRFSSNVSSVDGQVFVFFIITVAAAEVAIGLAILVALFRARQTTDVKDISSLKF